MKIIIKILQSTYNQFFNLMVLELSAHGFFIIVCLCSSSCFSMWHGRECSSFPLSLFLPQFSFLFSRLVHVESPHSSSYNTILDGKCSLVLAAFPAVPFGSLGQSSLLSSGFCCFIFNLHFFHLTADVAFVSSISLYFSSLT